jgi:hypothetical protein
MPEKECEHEWRNFLGSGYRKCVLCSATEELPEQKPKTVRFYDIYDLQKDVEMWAGRLDELTEVEFLSKVLQYLSEKNGG